MNTRNRYTFLLGLLTSLLLSSVSKAQLFIGNGAVFHTADSGIVTLQNTHLTTQAAITGAGTGRLVFKGDSLMYINNNANSIHGLELSTTSKVMLTSHTEVSGVLVQTAGKLATNGKRLTLSGIAQGTVGTITGSDSSELFITGSGAAGSLYFTRGDNKFKQLVVNRTNSGSVTIADSMIVKNLVLVTNGTVTSNNGSLTLAPGGIIPNNYDKITGTVTLQQNVIGQRGWRIFSNPFTSTQTISNMAANNGITINTTPNPASGLTDVRSFTNGSPTGWSNVTTNSLPANTPYAVFVRGLASEVTGLNYTGGPTPFTYSVSGTLNTNTITVTPAATNFTIVGNPFAAPVNSSALTNGEGKSYYLYQIARNGDGRTRSGGWSAQLSSSTSTPIPTLGVIAYEAGTNTPYNINSNNDINTVHTPAAGLFRTQRTTQPPAIIENLAITVEQGGVLQDNLFIRQDSSCTSIDTDEYDLPKLPNDNVNFYAVVSGTNRRLGIDARDVRKDKTTIPLGITAAQGSYQLWVRNYNIENVEARLIDKFLNTSNTILPQMNYPFTVTADTASRGNNRFEIVFNNKVLAPLPPVVPAVFNAKLLGNIGLANLVSIEIENADDNIQISITDMGGRVIKTEKGANGINRIPVALSNGLYLVQVSNGLKTITLKLMN